MSWFWYLRGGTNSLYILSTACLGWWIITVVFIFLVWSWNSRVLPSQENLKFLQTLVPTTAGTNIKDLLSKCQLWQHGWPVFKLHIMYFIESNNKINYSLMNMKTVFWDQKSSFIMVWMKQSALLVERERILNSYLSEKAIIS